MSSYTLLASTAAALSTCVGLPPGDTTTPQYWGDYMLDKYAAEYDAAMTNVEAGPAPLAQPRTVLLITGVTIPATWFDPIVLRLERDGFRPVVYEPPDLLSGDLVENAELLAQVVEEVRAQSGQDKIDILAECTGGLIARHYIQSLGGDQKVERMITFISPQHGLPKAAEAYLYAGWPALSDLTPGSEFLDTVNSGTLPPGVDVTSIYTRTDEFIQPYETSIIPGATNIDLGAHGFVGHYQFFYDPAIYLVMHDALVKGLPAGATPTPEPEPTPAPTPMSEDDPTDGTGCAATRTAALGDGTLIMLGLLAARRRRRRA